MVVYHRPRRAGVVGAFRARAVIRLDAVRNRGPAERDCVGVTAVDALVYLRPCAAVDLPFEDIAGKIAVFVRGSPPTDRQAFAAAHAGRNRDGRGLRGGAVPNDRVCSVGIRAIRYQDSRGQITKRANAVVAVVSVAPDHRARGIDDADVERAGRVSVGKPPIPRRIYVETAVRVFALAHGFRRGVGKAGTVVAEQGQLASRGHVAGQADFRTGRKEDFVGATLRTAAVHGRLAYGVGRSQQGRNEVRGEARKKARFRVVFVVVAPYVRIRRWRVRAMLGAVPLPGGGLTVQPLPQVRKGPAVIAVTAAVAVAVAGFDSVKAFQRNNALRNQGHSAGRVACVSLVGNFPNDRLTVVKRACIFDKRTDGKRIQTLGHCFSLSLNRF